MSSQYDKTTAVMRKNEIQKADDEFQARKNRQGSMGKSCGYELADVVLMADLDDEDSLRSSVEQIAAIATTARIFILEAIQNLRVRKSLGCDMKTREGPTK